MSLTFSQFSHITEIEPIPTGSSLLSMFEKLDDQRNGFLLHDELFFNLTTRGEKLPTKVVESLLANADYNEDKKFYYQKFCEAVLDTRDKLANLTVEKLQKDEDEFLVNSKTYKVKRKSSSPEKGRSVANSPTKSVCPTQQEETRTSGSVSVSSGEDYYGCVVMCNAVYLHFDRSIIWYCNGCIMEILQHYSLSITRLPITPFSLSPFIFIFSQTSQT